MTATDQRVAQGVADLREQLEVLGQVDPEDVRHFLDLVESTLARTAELPVAVPRHPAGPGAMPLGGRSKWPFRRRHLTPVADPGPGCGAVRPRFTGSLACVCTEARGHEPADHVARDRAGVELARWPVERPESTT